MPIAADSSTPPHFLMADESHTANNPDSAAAKKIQEFDLV